MQPGAKHRSGKPPKLSASGHRQALRRAVRIRYLNARLVRDTQHAHRAGVHAPPAEGQNYPNGFQRDAAQRLRRALQTFCRTLYHGPCCYGPVHALMDLSRAKAQHQGAATPAPLNPQAAEDLCEEDGQPK